MTISSAMHRLASRGPLRHGGVDVRRLPDDEAATVRQGVPVVLPVRESSPGGFYGTADEGHLLSRAVFPVGVRLAGQAAGRRVDQPWSEWPIAAHQLDELAADQDG